MDSTLLLLLLLLLLELQHFPLCSLHFPELHFMHRVSLMHLPVARLTLHGCSGRRCRNPWLVHANGRITPGWQTLRISLVWLRLTWWVAAVTRLSLRRETCLRLATKDLGGCRIATRERRMVSVLYHAGRCTLTVCFEDGLTTEVIAEAERLVLLLLRWLCRLSPSRRL